MIKDLGSYKWPGTFAIPVLDPQPPPEKGAPYRIVIGGSAGKENKGNGSFLKAVAGHMYFIRIKDDSTDSYVLFRVKSINKGDECTITWKAIDSPAK